MSQVNKLFIMLQDNKPHSTIDICVEVYGNEHAGLARVGARIWDLKKKYGLNIESWRDPKVKTIWWYRLIPKQNFIFKASLDDPVCLNHAGIREECRLVSGGRDNLSPQKPAEQKPLLDIKYNL